MPFGATKRRQAYSLVELLVVIAVISLIGVASIPNIFNRNDRLSLDSSANQLRQVIIDAQTRSKAPDKSDGASSTQVYQVAVGKFPQGAPNNNTVLTGNATTNAISLERGLAQCDSGDLQGGFATIRSLSFPRGIYVSSFFPTLQFTADDRAVIRFTVGQEGFSCGSYSNPLIKSASLNSATWVGLKANSSYTVARYMVITLSSQKVAEKRYITIDRETGEVAVSRSNPQSYYTPVSDGLAPRWTDVDPNKFTLSITCGTASSTILITFPRANDRVNDPVSAGDPNLLVTYGISWDFGSGVQPIVVGYFEDLSHGTVSYQFTTDRFTTANQPKQVTVSAAATDSLNHTQPASDPDATLMQRSKLFHPSCGAVAADPISDSAAPVDQTDPGGSSTACDPIIPITRAHGWRAIARILVPSAEAISASQQACPVEVQH